MGTEIVLGVLIVVVFIALSSSVKHFKGEGGCCGGSSAPKPKKQKLSRVVCVKQMQIEGMQCDNCRKNVENGLNSIEHVNAQVKLKEKTAIVKLGEDIPDEVLVAAVENLGYRVAGVKEIS